MTRQILIAGPLSITENGQPSDLLRHAKGCALVTFLLVRKRPETREYLADLFWESQDMSDSLRNLRVVLARIRPFLPNLEITRSTVQYIPRAGETVDYLQLTEILARRDADFSLNDLRLYRGELLENFYLPDAPRFMEWLVLERERLRRAVLDAHYKLCQQLAQTSDWQTGAQVAAHWLAIDDLDEQALRWQLQFLGASGEFNAVRQTYETFKKNLRQHLGVEPEAATQTLVRELSETENQRAGFPIPDAALTLALTSDILPEPGPLPANAILPYHRNDDFAGRAEVLQRVAHALGTRRSAQRAPTVALTGIGGMGKTQTAVEFAYRYGRFFPGGVFWLNFSEPENVTAEVAAVGSERGLGLFRETDELSLQDRVGRVQRAWQESVSRLLIFDDCDDETLFQRWLPVTGGCCVLLTSRQNVRAWAAGVPVISLDVLSSDESAHLIQRLAPHIADANARALGEMVGHLPLALHLAGSFLRRYQQIRADAYLAQLREKRVLWHPSLQGHGAQSSPTGHELSVGRTYAINWEQLNPRNPVDATARNLLAHAACLVSGEPIAAAWLFDAKSIAATTIENDADLDAALLTEDALARLAALGLIEREAGQTLVLHPLLELFTREMVGAQGMAMALDTVAAKMVQTLKQHRVTQGNLNVLPIPSSHVRHVSEALANLMTPLTAELLTLLGLHLDDIGSAPEAEQILERACRIAQVAGDLNVQARAWNALASAQEALGHDAESLASVQRAVALFTQANASDAEGLAEALYYQGWAQYRLGQADAALQSAQEGYALCRAAASKRSEANLLNLMGVVNYYLLGQYETAQSNLEASLAVCRELQNRQGESVALNNLGESARLQGNYQLAAQYYAQALAAAQEIHAHNKANVFLSNLCGARLYMGQYDAAITDLEKLIAPHIAEQTRHDWYGLSEAYRFLAEAYLAQNKTKLAMTMAQQALALANKTNAFDSGRAWRVLGYVAARLDKPIVTAVNETRVYDAAECFQHSLDFFQAGDLKRDRAIALWRWAEYEMRRGNIEQGEIMWQQARELFVTLNLPLMAARMKKVAHTRAK